MTRVSQGTLKAPDAFWCLDDIITREDIIMETGNDIRLRPDGSIDIAYYMRRGRRVRSRQAHQMAASLRNRIRAVLRMPEGSPKPREA